MNFSYEAEALYRAQLERYAIATGLVRAPMIPTAPLLSPATSVASSSTASSFGSPDLLRQATATPGLQPPQSTSLDLSFGSSSAATSSAASSPVSTTASSPRTSTSSKLTASKKKESKSRRTSEDKKKTEKAKKEPSEKDSKKEKNKNKNLNPKDSESPFKIPSSSLNLPDMNFNSPILSSYLPMSWSKSLDSLSALPGLSASNNGDSSFKTSIPIKGSSAEIRLPTKPLDISEVTRVAAEQQKNNNNNIIKQFPPSNAAFNLLDKSDEDKKKLFARPFEDDYSKPSSPNKLIKNEPFALLEPSNGEAAEEEKATLHYNTGTVKLPSKALDQSSTFSIIDSKEDFKMVKKYRL